MKNLAIILTLIAFMQIQVIAAPAANTNKIPAQKSQIKKSSTSVRTNNNQAYPTSGNDFLLKYNINDLEAAPWLHSGKREYK